MKSTINPNAKLGLYLALFWLSIISLPIGIVRVGLIEWWETISECWIGLRKGEF